MGATGGKREGQKRETSLLLAQFYRWNFYHLDSPAVLVLMRAQCNTFASELMGLDVYRAPGHLSSPDTGIGSSLSKHTAEVVGLQRLEMAPVCSLSLLVSWWGVLFFGLLQNPSTHNPTLTRVSKGQIDFWWISTNCFHWLIRIAFLSNSECYSGMGLKLKNSVVTNILSYSERGSNTSYRCLCSSILSLERQWIFKCRTWKCATRSLWCIFSQVFSSLHVRLEETQMRGETTVPHLFNYQTFNKAV